ncbi:hypothetical protein LINPERPRIM_LOCUS20021 [Linum perenne]
MCYRIVLVQLMASTLMYAFQLTNKFLFEDGKENIILWI